MKHTESQILFIRNMYWSTTINGAFQRSGVYNGNVDDNLKKNFRKALRVELERIELDYQIAQINGSTHIKNIISLQKWSEQFEELLNEGKINFGISQKLLNLHIKGAWCFGFIQYLPPHFPVDRIIQERLKMKPIIPWTKIEDENDYIKIIEKATVIAKKHHVTLAELELRVYNNTLKIER